MIVVCMAELTFVELLLHAWFPALPQWTPAFVVLLLLLFHGSDVRLPGEVEFWLALLKIVIIVGFIQLGLAAIVAPARVDLTGAHLSNFWRLGGVFPTGLAGFLAILPIALFPCDGIEPISLAAAETADPLDTTQACFDQIAAARPDLLSRHHGSPSGAVALDRGRSRLQPVRAGAPST